MDKANNYRSSNQELFCKSKKIYLISQEYICVRVSFFNKVAGRLEACNFIRKETPTEAFSCQFCEVFKNTFFHGTPPIAASGHKKTKKFKKAVCNVKKYMLILNGLYPLVDSSIDTSLPIIQKQPSEM